MRALDQDEKSCQGLGQYAIPPRFLPSPPAPRDPRHSHHAYFHKLTESQKSLRALLFCVPRIALQGVGVGGKAFQLLRVKRTTKVLHGGVPAASRIDQPGT